RMLRGPGGLVGLHRAHAGHGRVEGDQRRLSGTQRDLTLSQLLGAPPLPLARLAGDALHLPPSCAPCTPPRVSLLALGFAIPLRAHRCDLVRVQLAGALEVPAPLLPPIGHDRSSRCDASRRPWSTRPPAPCD